MSKHKNWAHRPNEPGYVPSPKPILCSKCHKPLGMRGSTQARRIGKDDYVHEKCPS